VPDPSYAYESQQSSLFKPYYQRWLWDRILNALPRSLSPNAMTVIGTLCCAASFAIAATQKHKPLALLVAAFLIIAYLSLDNLDGAQARRLGRSSRLGEFLDHWLDTLNNGFVFGGACLAAELPPLLTLAVICSGTLAFFAVQWELRATGVFRMGRIGDIEGNTAVALLYVGIAILGTQLFHERLLPGLPTTGTLLGCGVIAQALWTTLSALRRTSHRLGDFLPLIAASAVLVAWAWSGEQTAASYLAAALLLNPVFTSAPIRDRLRLAPGSPTFDWSIVAALAALALLSTTSLLGVIHADLGGTAAVTVLAVVTLRYFAVSVSKLRDESNRATPIEAIGDSGAAPRLP
jgi:phosphatidylglycerophosphate synthase